MLAALRKGWCFRAAFALAAFAAVCFVAPPAVLAFGGNALHCLSHADAVNHDMGVAVTGHDHGTLPAVPAQHHPDCCGLFCLSALMPAPVPLPQPAAFALAFAPLAAIGLVSVVADNPDPPPILVPSV
jgi:hypothetical protein